MAGSSCGSGTTAGVGAGRWELTGELKVKLLTMKLDR
jgi:hypothetical protein